MKKITILMMAVLTVCLTSCLGDPEENPIDNVQFATVNFDKASLPTSGAAIGVMLGQSYESENGYVFENAHNEANEGYTVSNNNDIKTAGDENLFSVYSASNNKANQFMFYKPSKTVKTFIQRKDGQPFYPYSIFIAPTTNTMLSVFNGSETEKKFDEKDSISVYIQGCDAQGNLISKSEIKFNFVKNLSLFQLDNYTGYGLKKFVYVQGSNNLWTQLPLYYLGKVSKIYIKMTCNEPSTPLSIALDDFTVVTQETMTDYEKYLNSSNK